MLTFWSSSCLLQNRPNGEITHKDLQKIAVSEVPLWQCLPIQGLQHKQDVCICFSCENQWSWTDGSVVPHYLLPDSDKCPPRQSWRCTGKQKNPSLCSNTKQMADVHSGAVFSLSPAFSCCLPKKHKILLYANRSCTSKLGRLLVLVYEQSNYLMNLLVSVSHYWW